MCWFLIGQECVTVWWQVKWIYPPGSRAFNHISLFVSVLLSLSVCLCLALTLCLSVFQSFSTSSVLYLCYSVSFPLPILSVSQSVCCWVHKNVPNFWRPQFLPLGGWSLAWKSSVRKTLCVNACMHECMLWCPVLLLRLCFSLYHDIHSQFPV